MATLEEQKRQLYNRQEYVIGAEAQSKYGSTSVLVVGACGLGAEIVKNLSLTGVKDILILDDTPVQLADFSTNFFLTSADVGKPRGAVVAHAAAELNRFVNVKAVTGDAQQHFSAVQVVVFVNQLTTTLVEANAAARTHDVKFVACENRGIAGSIFTDGGDVFEVLDADGEDTVTCVVTAISPDGLVTLHDDKKHECEVGSQIYFTGVTAPATLNSEDAAAAPRGTVPRLKLFEVAEVITPHILRLKNFAEAAGPNASIDISRGAYLHTTKKQAQLRFSSLKESVEQPDFALTFDSEEKTNSAPELHAIFRAVHAFGKAPESAQDVAEVLRRAQDLHPTLPAEFAEAVITLFRGQLNPMACFIGGLAAQEVLKLCSGKFTPIHQWLYYDARELLTAQGIRSPKDLLQRITTEAASPPSRYSGQALVFGTEFQKFLAEQHAFIVGAGALGCELIKNAALMGLGGVSITDMDQIEISNLSRQFLFRNHHIGRPKSVVAAEAARAINPTTRVEAYEDKMDPATEGIFNEHFWGRHAVVLNALDNVLSRKYVDGRCLFYQKPLFESGTLGTKCNMQCVIPHVTESYSSSYDPPEKSIPLCTLKNFPNAIEHTIQWARDQFHLLFNTTPSDVNQYLEDPTAFVASLERDPSGATVAIKNVYDALQQWPKDEKDCVVIARRWFEEHFNLNFQQLLYSLPLDKRNEDGQLFWSGAKRPPTPQIFHPDVERDAEFIYHFAYLIAEVYGLPPLSLGKVQAAALAAEVPVGAFVPRETIFSVSEADTKEPVQKHHSGDLRVSDLPPAAQFADRRMHALEFEKDDLSNHQVQFITYASNVRAEAYSIPAADVFHTKRIAGNIIPAMVTTTALVTGLVGFEVLKYLLIDFHHRGDGGGKYTPSPAEVTAQLSIYRNAFVNIALPLVAFSDPIVAEGKTYALKHGKSLRWSVWDRLDINEKRDITVNELVQLLQTRYQLDVFMIALTSGKMIFTEFGGKAKDKEKPVGVLALEKGEVESDGNDYFNLVATGVIGDDEDVDVPTIRYKYRNF